MSVIVPAYNEAANIAATVRSLVASDYPWLEVIVVDDGSTDGTAGHRGVAAAAGGTSRPAGRTRGKPAALNTGIRLARGELLVLVDGDTVFEPDAIGQLVQPFADPDVGAVSGNTKVANRRGLLGRWQHLEYVIGFNLDRRMFDLGECMPTVPGAIGAFRREALIDVGGVPTATLAEDTDLTMAILRAGWRVVYEPDRDRLDRGAGHAAPAVAAALPLVLRHDAGDVEAPRGAARARSGRQARSPRAGLPDAVPGAASACARRRSTSTPCTACCSCRCRRSLAVWLGFTAVQVAHRGYALHLDRERYGPLWALPLQQVVYRQLMYLVVVQSTVTALIGIRLRWQTVARTGAAHDVLDAR